MRRQTFHITADSRGIQCWMKNNLCSRSEGACVHVHRLYFVWMSSTWTDHTILQKNSGNSCTCTRSQYQAAFSPPMWMRLEIGPAICNDYDKQKVYQALSLYICHNYHVWVQEIPKQKESGNKAQFSMYTLCVCQQSIHLTNYTTLHAVHTRNLRLCCWSQNSVLPPVGIRLLPHPSMKSTSHCSQPLTL